MVQTFLNNQIFQKSKSKFFLLHKTPNCNFEPTIIFISSLILLKAKDYASFSGQHIKVTFLTTDKRTDVWSQPICIYTQNFSPKKLVFLPIKDTF